MKTEAHVFQALADAWRVAPKVRRSDWCEANLKIPERFASSGSDFDLSLFPWCREVIDMADDIEVRMITFMGGTQISKTTAGIAILVSDAYLDPAPCMSGYPDTKAMRYGREMIYGIADATEAFRGRLPAEHRRNFDFIDFGRSLTYLGISGSTQSLSGKPARKCFATEVDRWRINPREGPTAKLIEKRVRTFWRYLLWNDGTPSNEKSTIAKLYRQGDQRKFHVECPHCGRWQELRFFPFRAGKYEGRGGVVGITDEAGRFLEPDEARESAYYRCLNGCTITNADKQAIVPNGRWVPKGQRVNCKGKLVGKPLRGRRHVSFHLSALYALTRTFGDVAADYLAAKDDQAELAVFWNNDLGLPFRPKSKTPQWRTIGRRLAAQHRRGTVPAWAIFLTAGVDVQGDHLRWVVRAWGEDGTSALVDFGRIDERSEIGVPIKGSDLAQLDELIEKPWPLVAPNPVGEKMLRVWLAGVDMQFRTFELHNWSRTSRNANKIRLLAGETGLTCPWTCGTVDRNSRTGKPYPGGLKRWAINSDWFRADIQSRWGVPIVQPGAWLLFADVATEAEPYLRELVNEVPTYKRSPQGKSFRSWTKANPGIGNHFWDAEVLARAVAEMAIDSNWKGLAEWASSRPKVAPAPSKTPREPSGSSWINPGPGWINRR